MAQPARKPAHIQVDLEEEALRSHPGGAEAVALETKVWWLIDQVGQQRMGHSRAARFACLPVTEFLRLLGEHRVAMLDLDDAELHEQLDDLQELRS